MSLRLVLTALAVLAYATPALAMVDPPATGPADPRMRTVVYDPNNPVELTASPGATLRIQFGSDEHIAGIVVSDQDTINPPLVPEQQGGVDGALGGLATSASRGPSSCDPNLCRSVIGNFVYLKPLKALDPQPVFIQTERTDAYGHVEMVPYTFELLTRPGDQKTSGAQALWSVTFVYPVRQHAAQVAAWRKRQAEAAEAAKESAALAPRAPDVGDTSSNWRYGYRGSAMVEPDAAWDDGRTTFLRFDGNRRVPNLYRRLPDGKESIAAYTSEPDARGTTLRVGRTETKWFLRDGDEAGCLFDLGPDPHGATTMTVGEPTARAAR